LTNGAIADIINAVENWILLTAKKGRSRTPRTCKEKLRLVRGAEGAAW
jgi:hypothetical protein